MAGNTDYQDPPPQFGSNTQNTTPITLEGVLDKIAETIIASPHTGINPDLVKQNQKTIRNGIMTVGRSNSDKLILFQRDIKANAEDLQSTSGGETLSSIINTISEFGGGSLETTQVSIAPLQNGAFSIHLFSGDLDFDITNILSEISTNEDGTETILNPLNVSQFINIEKQRTTIDPEQAKEYLDTNIYELLPDSSLRQERINSLFSEINQLLPPNISDAQWGITNDGMVDRNPEGDWEGSYQYYLNNSISAPQDNPNFEGDMIDEEDGYVTRLQSFASSQNSGGKTIQELRNRLNLYLKDIDEIAAKPQDERLEYENKSDGYLRFRNLNQGIIIRNTNSEFVEGLHPDTQEYLQPGKGFTITMWVRFLDKTSQGTLFNFGNPTRLQDAFGFRLETYVVDRNNALEYGDETVGNFGGFVDSQAYLRDNLGIFNNTDSERFVRLVVNDNGYIRDSHIGNPTIGKSFEYAPTFTDNDVFDYNSIRLLSATKIPQDFNEWYFICASFNPDINENNSLGLTGPENEQYDYVPEFWLNHIDYENPTNILVNSTYGNKCKVEIISRTDLLRARGFKVD